MGIIILLTIFFSCSYCQSPTIEDPPNFPWTQLDPNSYGGTLAFGVATQSFVGVDGKLVTRGYLGYGVDPGCGPWPNVYSQGDVIASYSATSTEMCFRFCVMNKGCACYVLSDGNCQLQSKCQLIKSVPNASTGLVRESQWNMTSEASIPPLSQVEATSVSGCSDLCRANLGCASYSFSNNMCNMYAKFSPSFTPIQGSTYGAMCRGYTIPGPTITLNRGSTYYMTLLNTLKYQIPGVMNTIRDANITNIHTHGLHVSPIAPSDDIYMMANGGECLKYTWSIPSNHMGGTMWWHPNHHGATDLHVSTGALGLLIVKDDPILDGIPQNIMNMKTRFVLVQAIHARTGDYITAQSSIGATIYLVNGIFQGVFTMQAGTWERWRILHADSEPGIRTLTFPTFCTINLMAQDGVWRSTVPYPLNKPNPYPTVNVTGATRIDLAIMCTPSTLPSDGYFSIFGGITLATLHVVASPTPTVASNLTSWSPKFPSYLPSATWLSDVNYQSSTIVITSISVQVGNDATPFNPNYPKINISSSTTLQKWTITASVMMHPFHVHVNQFMMAADCGDFKKGEFYDVMVSNNSPCTVLYMPYFQGRVIMHCHNLIHEDLGVMTFANVLTGPGGPTPNIPDTCANIVSNVEFDTGTSEVQEDISSEKILLIVIIGVVTALFVGQTILLVVVVMRFRRLVKEATSDNYTGWVDDN